MRQRGDVAKSQMLHIRQLELRIPFQNMAQCMGSNIAEASGVGRFPDSHAIQYDKTDLVKCRQLMPRSFMYASLTLKTAWKLVPQQPP
ncbi:hypothetical protein D3C71_1986650 [compost metagenome]